MVEINFLGLETMLEEKDVTIREQVLSCVAEVCLYIKGEASVSDAYNALHNLKAMYKKTSLYDGEAVTPEEQENVLDEVIMYLTSEDSALKIA